MFHFTLQSILDVRKTQEDKILQEFSEQQRELQKEKDRLQSIQQQKRTLMDGLRCVQGKTVNVAEITMQTEYIQQCIQNEDLQKEQVKEVERMTEIKKESLLEAMKKRKSMETLKNRQYDQHQSDLNAMERTATDEMAIVRHNRKKSE